MPIDTRPLPECLGTIQDRPNVEPGGITGGLCSICRHTKLCVRKALKELAQ